MGLVDELLNFIVNGSVAGLPPLLVMAIPFIIGLVVGILARKILKVVAIVIVVLVVAVFLGLYTLDLPGLLQLAEQYGSLAVTFGALLIGVLPLSVGFFIGAAIGFILG